MRMMYLVVMCVDLVDLHSFPTRRSSDLGGLRRGGRPATRGGAGGRVHAGTAGARAICLGALQGAGARRRGARSEEHTSELQSRRDLVCRLLLEKKKTDRACCPSAGAAPC